MDTSKQKWLKRHGYKPMDDEVLKEWLHQLFRFNPRYALQKYEESKSMFSHYKRYGKQIMPYCQDYLEKTDIEILKNKIRSNIKNYIVNEMWPVKEALSLIFTFRTFLWRVQLFFGWDSLE